MSSQYSAAFKANVIRRLTGPSAISANALAEELGMSQPTLSRWLREARTVVPMARKKNEKKSPRTWTPAEKLRVVAAADGLRDEDLGEFLRREGIHEQQLVEWREAATAALSTGKPRKTQPSAEAKRIKKLEAELHRKEKALAEAAALLILKKKSRRSGGTRTTPPTRRAGSSAGADRRSGGRWSAAPQGLRRDWTAYSDRAAMEGWAW